MYIFGFEIFPTYYCTWTVQVYKICLCKKMYLEAINLRLFNRHFLIF